MRTETGWRQRRQRLTVFLAAGAVAFFSGWAVWHSYKKEVISLVWNVSRGTSLEPTVLKWGLVRVGDPVDRDLLAGRFGAGTQADVIVVAHPPIDRQRLGEYEFLRYYQDGICFMGGTTILARDGRAVSAWRTTRRYSVLYYGPLSSAEEARITALWAAEDARLDAERQLGPMAVAGFGASIDPWTLPQPDPAPE